MVSPSTGMLQWPAFQITPTQLRSRVRQVQIMIHTIPHQNKFPHNFSKLATV